MELRGAGRRRFETPRAAEEHWEWIELVGLQLGAEFERDGLPGVFLGVMRLAHTLASYAVFATTSKSTVTFKIHQTFADLDSDRVVKLFQESVLLFARERAETLAPPKRDP